MKKRLQNPWKLTQLGVLFFPLLPTVGAITLMVAVIKTWQQKWRTIIRCPENIGFAGLSLWLAIATIFAHNRQEAILGLANLLPFFAVFAGFSALIQKPSQLRRLSWAMVISSVSVVILGFGQLFLGWSGPLHLQIIFGWMLAPEGNPPGRMASVFMYANILAIYLTVVFILAVGLWLEMWKVDPPNPPLKGGLRIIKNRAFQKFCFLTVAIIFNGVALILTHSRNAWGLVVFASLAYAVYFGWRWLVGLVMTAVATVFGAAFAPSPLKEWLRIIVPEYFWARLTDQNFDRPVAILRSTQWQFAWNMTVEKPWSGWGLRNFTPLYEAQMQMWLGHPHNLLLMLTAETGIPAALFLFGLVGWILVKASLFLIHWADIYSRGERLIFFSYLVAFGACTIFNMFDVTLFDLRVNTMGWLLLAAICGNSSRLHSEQSIHTSN
ncbi:MAG: O-antigen ligase family protein [Microcoleaceae cyanobacterium MO_207.B10]|nr:O-antigen ligase family protein [Microcoleaceae cyanobacterium MO_207.B10]